MVRFLRRESRIKRFERVANLERDDNEAVQLPCLCSEFHHTGSSIVFPTCSGGKLLLPWL
jgi:hypothetical protein